METKQVRDKFISLIKENFSEVIIEDSRKKPGSKGSLKHERLNVFVPNKRKNKRWMQVDIKPRSLFVAMDHSEGDISSEDISLTEISYGLSGSQTGIELVENSSVKISFLNNDPYDFSRPEFLSFLKKHFKSYLKRIQ